MQRIFYRGGQALASLAALGVVLQTCAWAQQDPNQPVEEPRSWMLGYALVFLAIGLGLVVVCRPGGRSTEVKLELPE